jgi:ATP-dependent Zn protease
LIVSVHLRSDESDAHELDALTRQLRRELLSLDLDSVTLDREVEVPESAKGEAVAIGTLVMTLANSAVLVAACQVIRTWINRGEARGATIRFGKKSDRILEIHGASKAQNQQIIDAFLITMQHETVPFKQDK